jgi:hypothetical protein
MSSPRYNVIFRTCDAVQALRGIRPFGLDKRTLIKECFLSLYDALRPYPHTIHILGDKLSPEIQAFFRRFQQEDPTITLTNGDYGNDESIRQSLRLALAFPDDEWLYLCEDDYLHTPQAFEQINELITHRHEVLAYTPRRGLFRWFLGQPSQKPLILHPADYPDRYRHDFLTLSFVFRTRLNHWRQIANATFTLLAEAKTFKRYRGPLFRSAAGANDDYLSHWVLERLPYRGRALCLSPIPGVATHMHEDVMTPLVDWAAIHRAAADRLAAVEGRSP